MRSSTFSRVVSGRLDVCFLFLLPVASLLFPGAPHNSRRVCFPPFSERLIPPSGLALVHADFWKPQAHQWTPRGSSTSTLSHRALGHY